ncbi:MAG: DUF4160 domain-containing protein [Gemmatimonadetes bacterium]|nr:DUF4160 domain-containing protein [Gemmatimonadota bacterium]
MFAEPDAPHHRPHLHAYYQSHVGVFAVDEIELIAGELPRRQRRLVEAWAELHQHDLLADWDRLQSGQLPFKIDPLR